jgi:hypothetical protein
MGAKGDEINIWCGIIVFFETNGSTVMFVGIVCHEKWVSAWIPLSFRDVWV